jgi:hypothetical protein
MDENYILELNDLANHIFVIPFHYIVPYHIQNYQACKVLKNKPHLVFASSVCFHVKWDTRLDFLFNKQSVSFQ